MRSSDWSAPESTEEEAKKMRYDKESKKMPYEPNKPTESDDFVIEQVKFPDGVGIPYTEEDALKDLEQKGPEWEAFLALTGDEIYDQETFPKNCNFCIMDIDLNSVLFTECAKIAISQHNDENDSSYKLSELVKAIGDSLGVVAFLVYKAEDNDGNTLTFKTQFTISRMDRKHVVQRSSWS